MTRNRLIEICNSSEDQDLKDMIVYALTNDPLTKGDHEVHLQPALEEILNPRRYDYGTAVRLADGDVVTITQIAPGKGLFINYTYNRYWDTPFDLPISKAEIENYIREEDRGNYLPIKIL